MKKTEQIVIVTLIAVALVITAGVMWLFFGPLPGQDMPNEGKPEYRNVTIFDAEGKEILAANSITSIYDSDYWAYLEIVFSEVTEILVQQENCSEVQARELLFIGGLFNSSVCRF